MRETYPNELLDEDLVGQGAVETQGLSKAADELHDAALESDTLRALLRASEQWPLLTDEQEITLGNTVQAGKQAATRLETGGYTGELARLEDEMLVSEGLQAREDFMHANLRLVYKWAQHYSNYPIGRKFGFGDLYNEGFLGLIKAVDKFDPNRGNKFSTYASWKISKEIVRVLHDKGRVIRIPVHVHELIPAFSELEDQQKTDEEIMNALGVGRGMLFSLREGRKLLPESSILSLDEPIKTDKKDTATRTIADIVGDPVESQAMSALFEGSANQELLPARAGGALAKVSKFITAKDKRLLTKVMQDEGLTPSEERQRRRLAGLFEHPAVRAHLRSLVPQSRDPEVDWRDEAACIGHAELFALPGRFRGPTYLEQVRTICGGCAVRANCEQYFLDNRPAKARWIDGITWQVFQAKARAIQENDEAARNGA